MLKQEWISSVARLRRFRRDPLAKEVQDLSQRERICASRGLLQDGETELVSMWISVRALQGWLDRKKPCHNSPSFLLSEDTNTTSRDSGHEQIST